MCLCGETTNILTSFGMMFMDRCWFAYFVTHTCPMVLAGDSKRENSIPTLWPDWPDWPDLTGAPTCLSLYKFVIHSVDSVYFLTRPWRLVRP